MMLQKGQVLHPTNGLTDLDLVRQVVAEIRAPIVDPGRDVVKAVRKMPSRPPQNSPHPIFGTVLVEMWNEESRSAVMKNKDNLSKNYDIQRVR